VQDAVAAANLLYRPLLDRTVTADDLAAVQRRREPAVRIVQRLQVVVQDNVIGPTLGSRTKPTPPWALRLVALVPFLNRIPARLIGLGFRPEHVRTPDVGASPAGAVVGPTPPAP
jgi:hypothetical protein